MTIQPLGTFVTIFENSFLDHFVKQTKVSLLLTGLAHAYKRELFDFIWTTMMASNIFLSWITVSIIQTRRSICYQQRDLEKNSSMNRIIPKGKQELNLGTRPMYWHGPSGTSKRLFQHNSLAYPNCYLMRVFKHTSHFACKFHRTQRKMQIVRVRLSHLKMASYCSNCQRTRMLSICYLCAMKWSFSRMAKELIGKSLISAYFIRWNIKAQNLNSKWYWISCWWHSSLFHQCAGYCKDFAHSRAISNWSS